MYLAAKEFSISLCGGVCELSWTDDQVERERRDRRCDLLGPRLGRGFQTAGVLGGSSYLAIWTKCHIEFLERMQGL